MRHFFGVEDFGAGELRRIVEESVLNPVASAEFVGRAGALGLIFMEPSTRTRVSFELAAKRLGYSTLLLGKNDTSLSKDETLWDTLENLSALGCKGFVVRASQGVDLEGLCSYSKGAIINAGDGVREHPSQALLDLATLWDKAAGRSWEKLQQQKWVIVGDLKHSRVAGSWFRLAKLLDIKLSWVSPAEWKPAFADSEAVDWSSNLKPALEGVTGVMALRVQRERLDAEWGADSLSDYVSKYQVTAELLGNRFLMHPGPVNWGIEVSASLRSHSRSLILDQVERGLYLRTSLLRFCL
jgi:aspartate carbamoyltransferase catalytic subunit